MKPVGGVSLLLLAPWALGQSPQESASEVLALVDSELEELEPHDLEPRKLEPQKLEYQAPGGARSHGSP